jgi:hypothetical protein
VIEQLLKSQASLQAGMENQVRIELIKPDRWVD